MESLMKNPMLFLLAWLLAGLSFHSHALAEQPAPADQVAPAEQAQAAALPTLDDLAKARRLVMMLSEPLVKCRQQLDPAQLDRHIRLGRLDALEALTSRHQASLPQAERWTNAIQQQRKLMGSQTAR